MLELNMLTRCITNDWSPATGLVKLDRFKHVLHDTRGPLCRPLVVTDHNALKQTIANRSLNLRLRNCVEDPTSASPVAREGAFFWRGIASSKSAHRVRRSRIERGRPVPGSVGGDGWKLGPKTTREGSTQKQKPKGFGLQAEQSIDVDHV